MREFDGEITICKFISSFIGLDRICIGQSTHNLQWNILNFSWGFDQHHKNHAFLSILGFNGVFLVGFLEKWAVIKLLDMVHFKSINMSPYYQVSLQMRFFQHVLHLNSVLPAYLGDGGHEMRLCFEYHLGNYQIFPITWPIVLLACVVYYLSFALSGKI